MAAPESSGSLLLRTAERTGRSVAGSFEALGYGGSLFVDSLFWLFLGRTRKQTVRPDSIFAEMMEIGIAALPIVSLLSLTIGMMLAIQGINVLATFGAEHQIVVGVAFSITREFAPLITGILVAGRSGSALAARLATMTINSEVDALRVMGINPVRFLVAPSLIAMVIMLPALTLWSDFLGLLGSAIYARLDLDMPFITFVQQTNQVLDADDVLHGLAKSVLFAILVTLVGVVDGSSVKGGAEGVGKATTAAVVHSITALILCDMVFAFVATR